MVVAAAAAAVVVVVVLVLVLVLLLVVVGVVGVVSACLKNLLTDQEQDRKHEKRSGSVQKSIV